MTVTVEVIAEALVTGWRRTAMRGSFETVAVDEHGRRTPLASLTQNQDQDEVQREFKS